MRRAAALLLLLASCTGGGEPGQGGSTPQVPVCEPPMAAPDGFELLPRFEEEYPDHVGVRLGYRDAERREVHVAAGVPGEWGEGLPVGGSVELAGGGTVPLLGSGRRAWLAVWDAGDRCDPQVVLVNGFSRREFLGLLEDAGIAASA